jgi:anti-sigma factor RsiW
MAKIIRFGGDHHRQTQQSLPWYVMDQLDAHERTEVEAHLADCAACRRDLETERELAAQIVNLPLDADASWAAVRGRIRPRNPPPTFQNLRGRLSHIRAPNRLGWLVAGQALVVAAGYVAFVTLPQRVPAEYHALSAQPAYNAGNVIAIFRPDISEQQFRTALIGHRARVVDGPTASGAYVLRVPESERPAILAELQQSKDVVLAQPIAAGPR